MWYCLQGMSDHSAGLAERLSEWLEVLLALGVDKVFLYELGVHPRVQRLLQLYPDSVHTTKLTLPGHQPNQPQAQDLYLR